MPAPSLTTDRPISKVFSISALAAGLLLLGGCDRDQVTRSSPSPMAPAPAATPMPGGMPGGAPAGMAGEVPPPPAPTTPLHWTLPQGWTSAPGSGMRFATLNPPGPGKIECSVVCLPGQAGGELANVNRWRGQIGLEPIDDQALAAARKTVKSKAGPVAVFDFTSPGQAQTRMLAATLLAKDGSTWFLKLVGDAAPVGKARPDYLRFLETLHLD